jgi:5-formyltetrahydrofolate cyclo-ligase
MRADSVTQDWNEIRIWHKAMRQELLGWRLAISAADRIAHGNIVTAILRRTRESVNSNMVGFYWPFKGEYDPRPLIRALEAQRMRFALPVVIEKASSASAGLGFG